MGAGSGGEAGIPAQISNDGLPARANSGIASLFSENQPTATTQLPQIMQPSRQPLPTGPTNPPPLTPSPRPQGPQAAPTPQPGIQGLLDTRAQQQGFQNSNSLQGFLQSLNPGQRNAYNEMDMRQSGSSIQSPTGSVWTQTNPEMISAMTQWHMKEKFPQLFGGGGAPAPQAPAQPSAAQQLAQRINGQYMRETR
jgi:hypothetical protein